MRFTRRALGRSRRGRAIRRRDVCHRAAAAPPPPPPSARLRPPRRHRARDEMNFAYSLVTRTKKSDKASLHEFRDVRDVDGESFDFSTLRGRVVLVANVASK
mmetsp:Transcript_14223/g.51143  ORF Transcript_14223/g.51143 Transcript_14223/m.51143 type:complete len:102 (-) Transcript_14223:638-943(-)